MFYRNVLTFSISAIYHLVSGKECLTQEEFFSGRRYFILSIWICFSSLEDKNNSNHIFLVCLLAANPRNKQFTCIILILTTTLWRIIISIWQVK